MSVTPTGRIDRVDDRLHPRPSPATFHAPIEDVWAAVTEPERLARWIGTWTGDPATGTRAVRDDVRGSGAAPGTRWRSASASRRGGSP